jgi:hypothetical protein
MAAGNFTIYNETKKLFFDGTLDWDTDGHYLHAGSHPQYMVGRQRPGGHRWRLFGNADGDGGGQRRHRYGDRRL